MNPGIKTELDHYAQQLVEQGNWFVDRESVLHTGFHWTHDVFPQDEEYHVRVTALSEAEAYAKAIEYAVWMNNGGAPRQVYIPKNDAPPMHAMRAQLRKVQNENTKTDK